MGALLHNGDDQAPDLGCTANAVLLLGYLYGRFAHDETYVSESADTATGTLIVRHRFSGNGYRITIAQHDGTEFAPPRTEAAE